MGRVGTGAERDVRIHGSPLTCLGLGSGSHSVVFDRSDKLGDHLNQADQATGTDEIAGARSLERLPDTDIPRINDIDVQPLAASERVTILTPWQLSIPFRNLNITRIHFRGYDDSWKPVFEPQNPVRRDTANNNLKPVSHSVLYYGSI